MDKITGPRTKFEEVIFCLVTFSMGIVTIIYTFYK